MRLIHFHLSFASVLSQSQILCLHFHNLYFPVVQRHGSYLPSNIYFCNDKFSSVRDSLCRDFILLCGATWIRHAVIIAAGALGKLDCVFGKKPLDIMLRNCFLFFWPSPALNYSIKKSRTKHCILTVSFNVSDNAYLSSIPVIRMYLAERGATNIDLMGCSNVVFALRGEIQYTRTVSSKI